MSAADLATVLVSGLLLGGLYAFMSYGLGLIYGVMKVVNLTHGALLTLGAYLTLWLYTAYGVDPLAGLLLVGPAGFVLGAIVEASVVRPIRHAPPIASLLLLFGLWQVIKNGIYLWYGGDDQALLTSYSFARIELGVPVGLPRAIVFAVSLGAFGALHVLLESTRLGRSIRAVAQDGEAASLVGIDVDRIWWISFGLGSALATTAGGLMALLYSFNPEFGASFLLKSFCVVVLGGVDRTGGILLGGLALGLAESVSVVFLPSSFQDLVSFVLLVAALVVKASFSPGSRG